MKHSVSIKYFILIIQFQIWQKWVKLCLIHGKPCSEFSAPPNKLQATKRLKFMRLRVTLTWNTTMNLLACVSLRWINETRYWDVLWVTAVLSSPTSMFALCNIRLTTRARNIVQPDRPAALCVCVPDELTVVSDRTRSSALHLRRTVFVRFSLGSQSFDWLSLTERL